MNFYVENKEVAVGAIRIIGVAASSVFLIGDTEVITCSSMFDTPPESLIIGRIAPLPAPQGGAAAQGAAAAGAEGAPGTASPLGAAGAQGAAAPQGAAG